MIKPELGKKYRLWRDNEFIGVANFVSDVIHGNCFLDENNTVYVADKWEEIKGEWNEVGNI